MSGGFVRGVSRTMAELLLVTGLSLAKATAGPSWPTPAPENPASR